MPQPNTNQNLDKQKEKNKNKKNNKFTDALAIEELDHYVDFLVQREKDEHTFFSPSPPPPTLDEETVEVVQSLVEMAQISPPHFAGRQQRIWQRVIDSASPQPQTNKAQPDFEAVKNASSLLNEAHQPSVKLNSPRLKVNCAKLGIGLVTSIALGLLMVSVFLSSAAYLDQGQNEKTTGFAVRAKTQLESPPLDLAWSSDGKYLAVTTSDKVVLTDKAGRTLKILNNTNNEVFSKVAWSPDAKSLAVIAGQTNVTSNCLSCTVRFWKINEEKADALIEVSSPVLDLAWLPDNQHLFTLSEDKGLRYWDTSGKMLINRLTGAKMMALTADGARIATVDSSERLSLWNVSDLVQGLKMNLIRSYVETVVPVSDWQSVCMGWSANGQLLAQGYETGKILLTGRFSKTIGSYWQQSGAVESLGWAPNGKYLVSGSDTSEINLWQLNDTYSVPSITLVKVLTNQTGAITKLAWSPDGATIVSGSDDKSLVFWSFPLNNSSSIS